MKHKVYLTQSAEIAEIINESFRNVMANSNETSRIQSIKHFKLHDQGIAPEIYHNKGYWCVHVEYDGNKDGYELILG